MNRLINILVLALTVALQSAESQGIFEVKDGPVDPAAVLITLYTNFPYFSADATVTVAEDGATNCPPMAFRYSVANGMISSVFSVARLSPEAGGVLKQLGLDEIKCIFGIHTNEATVVYPGMKGFYKLILPPSTPHFAPMKVQKKLVGSESKRGHQCRHFLLEATGTDQLTTSIECWEAEDLNGFPVQLTYSTKYFYALGQQKATVTMSIGEVSFARLDPAVFQPPEGSKQFSDRNALMGVSRTEALK